MNNINKYFESKKLYDKLPSNVKHYFPESEEIIFDLKNMNKSLNDMSHEIQNNVNTILKHNLEVVIFPFDYKDRVQEKDIYMGGPYLFKKDNLDLLKFWQFWDSIFKQSQVDFDYSRDKRVYEKKRHQLFEKNFYEKLWFEYSKIMYDLYKSEDKWLDNSQPEFETFTQSSYDYKRFTEDKFFAEKFVINNRNAKIFIIGDIHSSMHSTYDIFDDMMKKNIFKKDVNNLHTMELLPDNYIIFLGDIVDRGPYGLELLAFVYYLKIINKNNVFIINGNHEDKSIYDQNGLSAEREGQIGQENDVKSLTVMDSMLFYLPSVLYVKFNGAWYHFSHGGISYKDTILHKKIDVKKFLDSSATYYYLNSIPKSDKKYYRIKDDEDDIGHGFKWDDFDQTSIKPHFNRSRRAGYEYGPNTVIQYLNENKINCVISGHQDLVKLALLQHENKNKVISNYVFGRCSYDENKTRYNLYVPCGKKSRKSIKKKLIYNFDHNKRHNINLKPGINFVALVTSTATISKGIGANTYLILSLKNNLN